MKNELIITAYAIYLPIVLGLTYFVAQTLFKTGKVFMMDIFHGREDISNATNKLFQMGFYLINIGFALWILKISAYGVTTYQHIIEALSYKIGGFSIYLGVALFLNLLMFFRGKKVSKENKAQRLTTA